MELVIRDAVIEDAPAIAQLNRDGMGYDYPVERTREKLRACLGNPSHKILVAESEGVVVGYVHLEDYDTLYADSLKNILGIAVAESCRRQGVGKALLQAGEEWAASTGAAGVRLVSGESRKGAHAFYQTLGYTGNKLQRNFKKRLP